MGLVEMTVPELQKITGWASSSLYKLLNGYNSRGNTYSGLLEKCPAISVYERSVTTGEDGRTIHRKTKVYAWDSSLYAAWVKGGAVSLRDESGVQGVILMTVMNQVILIQIFLSIRMIPLTLLIPMPLLILMMEMSMIHLNVVLSLVALMLWRSSSVQRVKRLTWLRMVRRNQSVKQCGKMRLISARVKQVLHNQNLRILLRIVHTHMYIVVLPYVKQNIHSHKPDQMSICVHVHMCVVPPLQNTPLTIS
jgi:hypothetical protein